MWGLESWGTMTWGGQVVPLFGPLGLAAMLCCLLVGGSVMHDPRRRRWLARALGVALLLVPVAGVATVVLPNTFSTAPSRTPTR